MFAKANWAVIGLDPTSLEAFKLKLDTPSEMLSVSQLTAAAITTVKKQNSTGLNPFARPRLDEQEAASYSEMEALVRLIDDPDGEATEDQINLLGYHYGVDSFQIDSSGTRFGLWFVTNEWKDVSHIASLKEGYAYREFRHPYKFLSPEDKKTVDSAVNGVTAAKRNQFPLLIDFSDGYVFAECTNANQLQELRSFLSSLDVKMFSVCWGFGSEPNWPSTILKRMYDSSRYVSDFQKAAEDASRFNGSDREEIEDPELRTLVRHYFSTSQMESELWTNLGTPAKIALGPVGPMAVTQTPELATTLLNMNDQTAVKAAMITFQERISYIKAGEERVFRRDVLSVELSDGVNLVDAGAALLKGFDLPGFRKSILKDMKATKSAPSIERFWTMWLLAMNDAVRTINTNFRDVLELEGTQKSGIIPMHAKDETSGE